MFGIFLQVVKGLIGNCCGTRQSLICLKVFYATAEFLVFVLYMPILLFFYARLARFYRKALIKDNVDLVVRAEH